MKPLLIIALLYLLIVTILVSGVFSTIAQIPNEVNGIIKSDIVWSKANSPYDLTGNVFVDVGVTLTIEPGVVVNLKDHYILVNGTLTAKGDRNLRIYFNDGAISFTQSSVGWNQNTLSGSTLQNCVLDGTAIGIGSSPAILNNYINAGIGISEGSPIINGNYFTARQFPKYYGGSQYTNEALNINYGPTAIGTAVITDNIISGSFDDACILIDSGSPIIQRNLISDGPVGIDLSYRTATSNPKITNNTIKSCFIGISVGAFAQASFNYNNFEDITNYTVRSSYMQNTLDAAFNWWGTDDAATIDQKILDYHDDFTMDKVNYVPFLNAANPQAVPNTNVSIPTPDEIVWPSSTPISTPTGSLSQNPSVFPSQNIPDNFPLFTWGWLGFTVLMLLFLIIALLVFIVFYLRKRSINGSVKKPSVRRYIG